MFRYLPSRLATLVAPTFIGVTPVYGPSAGLRLGAGKPRIGEDRPHAVDARPARTGIPKTLMVVG